MEEKKAHTLKDGALLLANLLMENYWSNLWRVLNKNPDLKENFTNFLINPEKIIFYIGRTHWGVEYVGSLNSEELDPKVELEISIIDYSKEDDLLKNILGIDYSNQTGPIVPLLEYNEDLVHPTNEAMDIMLESNWNFHGQSMLIGINLGGYVLQENKFHRIINGFFYGTNSDGLVTRNVKWLDFFPLKIDESDENVDEFAFGLWPNIEDYIYHDAQFKFPRPVGFREEKWYSLNRFVEIISSKNTTEPQITAFLAKPENQFILKMALMGKNIYPEIELEWQSEENKAIRPDFFIEGSNGFSDIVEFKLPNLKSINNIVGRENRKTFSAEINSYIAQTRDYEYYFEDPRNKDHALTRYGIKVQYPKRILIMGRRWMLETSDWRRLENDNRNITIKTYDEIIDLVLSHLYS